MNPEDNGKDDLDLDDLEFSEHGRRPKWLGYLTIAGYCVVAWVAIVWLITCWGE